SVRPPPARRGLARFHRPRAALGRLRSLGEAGGRRVLKREGRLLALGLVLALLFAADALAATVWTRLPLDLEITRTVQAIPWRAPDRFHLVGGGPGRGLPRAAAASSSLGRERRPPRRHRHRPDLRRRALAERRRRRSFARRGLDASGAPAPGRTRTAPARRRC